MEYTVQWLYPNALAGIALFFSLVAPLFFFIAPSKVIRGLARIQRGDAEPNMVQRAILKFLSLRNTVYWNIRHPLQSKAFGSIDNAVLAYLVKRIEGILPADSNSESSTFDFNAPPIWEVIAEVTANVPDEEWKKLPTDFSKSFDSYQGND